MFVNHCKVDQSQVLHFPKKTKSKPPKKKAKVPDPATDSAAEVQETPSGVQGLDEDDRYHPVACGVCNTEIGVYDSDEVYHFFNVIASYTWSGH